MSEYSRSDPEYFRKTLDQVFEIDSLTVALGITAIFAPETLDELIELVDAVREPHCSVSNSIDQLVQMS